MKKILILEDQEVLGGIYKKRLEDAGFEVRWCLDIDSCKKSLKDFPADLAVLDHGIHGNKEGGLQMIPYFKKALPQCKVVMISNYSQFQLEREAMAAGAVRYLVKINTPPALLVKVAQELMGA